MTDNTSSHGYLEVADGVIGLTSKTFETVVEGMAALQGKMAHAIVLLLQGREDMHGLELLAHHAQVMFDFVTGLEDGSVEAATMLGLRERGQGT